MFDTIIIGAGPAGMTAGIYAARREMKTLIISKNIGGQVIWAAEIENYPGFKSIQSFDLINNMKEQVEGLGVEIKNDEVKEIIKKDNGNFEIVTNKEKYEAKTVIVTMGLSPRRLAIPGEEELGGKGVTYCANCDGPFYRGKKVIVVGGGNSALEEAVSLTKYASKVTVIHQFNHFQALEHYIDEAKANEKIEFIMESEIAEFYGDDKLSKVKIENMKTHEFTEMNIDGVFILIGYIPNTEMFEGVVELTDRKEIIATRDMETNISGVFAAGDCTAKKYRQVTTAVADGTIAGLAAVEYVSNKK